MQQQRVVNGLYKSADVLAGIICILMGRPCTSSCFSVFHEALRLRIGVRIADTAHAGPGYREDAEVGSTPRKRFGGFKRSSQQLVFTHGSNSSSSSAGVFQPRAFPVQTVPIAAFECSSQPPTSECCDGRLNPAVGMIDEAPGYGLALSDRHLEKLDGKACSKMRIQRTSDDLSAKRVKDNGKEGNSSARCKKVISATHSWFTPLRIIPLARFCTTANHASSSSSQEQRLLRAGTTNCLHA